MDSPVQPWYKRALAAIGFTASTVGFLFTLTSVPLGALLIGRGLRTPLAMSVVCVPLAAGGLLLTMFTLFVPSLVAGNRIQFPLNLTLPTLYCGFVLLASHLFAALRSPIALIGETPRLDQLWTRPDFLGTAWLIQTVGMSFSAALAGRKSEAQA